VIVDLSQYLGRRFGVVDDDRIAPLRMIASARQARQAMNSGLQHQIALAAIETIGTPRTPELLEMLISASELVVDALSGDERHAEARERAAQTRDLVNADSPRSLLAYRADRHYARVLELEGDPGEAMHRQMGAFTRMRHAVELGEDRITEQLQALQLVLSAAKRAGSTDGRRFAARACHEGDILASKLEAFVPSVVAYYRQRSGFAQAWLATGEAARRGAIDMLEWSLKHRRVSTRDCLTSGMIVGEIQLQRGEREQAIHTFAFTRERFEDKLPRKYVSAGAMLSSRGLLAADL